MTPDELPSQPRKASWKRWIVVLAGVVAVITIVLLAIPPKEEPVRVWFVRATNSVGLKLISFAGSNGVPVRITRPAGQREFVFEGMNGLSRRIEFSASLFTGTVPQAKVTAGSRTVYDWTINWPTAGTSFCFTLDAPSNEIPYYVEWEYRAVGLPMSRRERLRMECHDFFIAHGMRSLGARFRDPTYTRYIPSTDIKE